jgi:hypothetical protein
MDAGITGHARDTAVFRWFIEQVPEAAKRRKFCAGRKSSAFNDDSIVVVSMTKPLLGIVAVTAPPVTRIMASAA